MLTIHNTANDLRLVQLFVLCSSYSGQLLPFSKEAVADPLPKYLLSNVTESSKEAVADPIRVQSTIATRYGMFGLLCSR